MQDKLNQLRQTNARIRSICMSQRHADVMRTPLAEVPFATETLTEQVDSLLRVTDVGPIEVPVYGCMSYSPSSSSNSPSSSAVASWYCWYSETRSFMLLSASVNSISSMPSPV